MSIRSKLLVTLSLALFLTRIAHASITFQMSFEEATAGADLVVLGFVQSSPEFGEMDPQRREIVKRNVISVDEYLKGSGSKTITVLTVGGRYKHETGEGTVVGEISSDVAPQLPKPGTPVLLFLRALDEPGTYRIFCATHGVVPVNVSGNEPRTVNLLVRNRALLPPSPGQAADVDTPSNDGLPESKPILAVVSLPVLRDLVHQVTSK